jgi:hypothetical protein
MKTRKILFTAVSCMTAIAMLAGCSDSSSENSSSETTDSEVKIYLDDTGPYYMDADGNQTYLSVDNGDETDTDSYSSDPIYGEYDQDGISFTINDGWYADTSYGIPLIYEDGNESMYEYIGLVEASNIIDVSFDELTKADMEEIFEQYVDAGTCLSYELEQVDTEDANGYETKTFDVTVEAEDYTTDDSTEETSTTSYYTEYMFVNSDTPYVIVTNAMPTEESISKCLEVRDGIMSTLTIDVEDTSEDMSITDDDN